MPQEVFSRMRCTLMAKVDMQYGASNETPGYYATAFGA
jgi:hypothetical protein